MTKMTFIFDTGSSVRESDDLLSLLLYIVVLGPKYGLCKLQIFVKTIQYKLIQDVLAC